MRSIQEMSPRPGRSAHGTTEKIISTKDSANTHMTAFCEPVISGGSPSLSISRALSSSVHGTSIFSG